MVGDPIVPALLARTGTSGSKWMKMGLSICTISNFMAWRYVWIRSRSITDRIIRVLQLSLRRYNGSRNLEELLFSRPGEKFKVQLSVRLRGRTRTGQNKSGGKQLLQFVAWPQASDPSGQRTNCRSWWHIFSPPMVLSHELLFHLEEKTKVPFFCSQ